MCNLIILEVIIINKYGSLELQRNGDAKLDNSFIRYATAACMTHNTQGPCKNSDMIYTHACKLLSKLAFIWQRNGVLGLCLRHDPPLHRHIATLVGHGGGELCVGSYDSPASVHATVHYGWNCKHHAMLPLQYLNGRSLYKCYDEF